VPVSTLSKAALPFHIANYKCQGLLCHDSCLTGVDDKNLSSLPLEFLKIFNFL
jgi:hypothetical protein